MATYWNALAPESKRRWTPIRGLEGMAEELTLSIDPATGEYTRLTRFLPGADTTPFGGKSHTYPEEVFVVSGRLYYIPEGKSQDFVKWADALIRRVRSRYVREGFYVAPHAAKWRAESGGEFQQL